MGKVESQLEAPFSADTVMALRFLSGILSLSSSAAFASCCRRWGHGSRCLAEAEKDSFEYKQRATGDNWGHGTYKGDLNCTSMDCVDLVLVLGSGFRVDFIL